MDIDKEQFKHMVVTMQDMAKMQQQMHKTLDLMRVKIVGDEAMDIDGMSQRFEQHEQKFAEHVAEDREHFNKITTANAQILKDIKPISQIQATVTDLQTFQNNQKMIIGIGRWAMAKITGAALLGGTLIGWVIQQALEFLKHWPG